MKFPLRMLSIQQLERISSVIIYAERVRSTDSKIFSGSEFSLGYFVGESDDFPKYYNDLRRRLYTNKGGVKSPAPESIVLSRCTLCDKSNRGTVRLIDDSCPRCSLVNAIENKYCSKCSYPLVPSALDEIKEAENRKIQEI